MEWPITARSGGSSAAASTEQLEFLEQLGCHLYQGYLHSRPLPLPEFRKLLLEAPADY